MESTKLVALESLQASCPPFVDNLFFEIYSLCFTLLPNPNHLRRRHWDADLTPVNCNIPASWLAGRNQAHAILSTSQLSPDVYDYDSLLIGSGVDFLRPLGGNKYFGISSDDAGEDPSNPAPLPPIPDNHHQTHHSTDEDADDELEVREFEEGLEDFVSDEVLDPDLLPLDPSPGVLPTPSGPGIRPLDWCLYKGNWVHKASIVQILINTGFNRKSLNRLGRCASFTKSLKRKNAHTTPARPSAGTDIFTLGDPFVCLVRSGGVISAALARSTTITHNGYTVPFLKYGAVQDPKTRVKGQVLDLRDITTPTDDGLQTDWYWTGDYIKEITTVQGISHTGEKPALVTSDGHLVQRVNTILTQFSERPDLDRSSFPSIPLSVDFTWQVPHETLTMTCSVLHITLVSAGLSARSLKTITPLVGGGTFPYAIGGRASFVAELLDATYHPLYALPDLSRGGHALPPAVLDELALTALEYDFANIPDSHRSFLPLVTQRTIEPDPSEPPVASGSSLKRGAQSGPKSKPKRTKRLP
ncbi:hypothetical protein CONPUDRAFT_159808 [Coniophora puteana RWD-64-598 SS2]|uniref:Uncharacterized protein n=1 Tax=Coniophora puteana (strain RWD-64-598) TaxID=741705 RepID=R7SFJ0_CONPW|nr:uncharacterized protein CONPUDRAFT_159808 [Coniophora puteana RWD-64-598 SS2]EIW74507.1 hypothetical protein CONPUDRAFT_159808 [Coniophora puteana RWD-64-598 SS2]